MTSCILRPTDVESGCWACGAPDAHVSGVFVRVPDGTPLHGVLLCRACHDEARDGGAVHLVGAGEGTFRVVRRPRQGAT